MIDNFRFPHPEGCVEKLKTLTMTLEVDNKMATKYFPMVSDYRESEAPEREHGVYNRTKAEMQTSTLALRCKHNESSSDRSSDCRYHRFIPLLIEHRRSPLFPSLEAAFHVQLPTGTLVMQSLPILIKCLFVADVNHVTNAEREIIQFRKTSISEKINFFAYIRRDLAVF